jgi:hypothetical protein
MLFANSPDATETIQKYFRRKRIPYTEDALLAVLEDGTQRQAVYWATIGLRDVGTMRSVPFLQAKLHYPMQDVKDCAILTVAHIAGAAATDFYVDALLDKRTRKLYPMWAIRVAADERAIDAVLAYVGRVLQRLERPTPSDPGDAYVDGLEYLARFHAIDPRIPPMFDRVRRIWHLLPAGAQSRLAVSIPNIAPAG